MNWRSRIGQLVVAAAAFTMTTAAKGPTIGHAAPDFEVRTMDGGTLSLAELRGQVVVLNFWATWCVPCRRELPLLDAYYRRRAANGLRVFAITTEDSLPNGQLKKLFAVMAITPIKGIKGPYGVKTGVPTNSIIDRHGVLRYAKAGSLELDDLNRQLVPLLNEPA